MFAKERLAEHNDQSVTFTWYLTAKSVSSSSPRDSGFVANKFLSIGDVDTANIIHMTRLEQMQY